MSARAEGREHLAHQLRPDAAAARVAGDVEIRQRPEPGRAAPREREPDGRSVVVLGDERDLGVDDLPHLGELLLEVCGPSWVGGGTSWSNCRQRSAIAS